MASLPPPMRMYVAPVCAHCARLEQAERDVFGSWRQRTHRQNDALAHERDKHTQTHPQTRARTHSPPPPTAANTPPTHQSSLNKKLFFYVKLLFMRAYFTRIPAQYCRRARVCERGLTRARARTPNRGAAGGCAATRYAIQRPNTIQLRWQCTLEWCGGASERHISRSSRSPSFVLLPLTPLLGGDGGGGVGAVTPWPSWHIGGTRQRNIHCGRAEFDLARGRAQYMASGMG